MGSLERVSRNRAFKGWQEVWQHDSESTRTPMKFGIYLPSMSELKPCPVLYWLSGLTCTEQNFITKAASQAFAEQHGIIVVAPDTSPRGTDLPGEHEDWDFGSGAGFYLDATESPWSDHYRMESYILKELPALVRAHFPVNDFQSIAGHSMGGHGALTLGLKNRAQFASISAFAPISAPTLCPWGKKAFAKYLGENPSLWEDYDAHLLIQKPGKQVPIRIDQGLDDGFLNEQLMPQLLEEAASKAGYHIEMNYHEGYDHSFYFIATFIEEHFAFHALYLKA